MPPRRRVAPASASTEKKARPSKLAKENNITAEQEAEIKEAYHLFAVEHEDYEDEKEGVIPRGDIRRCMVALGIPPSNPDELAEILDALDPEHSGHATYEPFLSICALKLNARTGDAISEEVEKAYELFTKGGSGPITLGHLRRIARELKEDVSDELLRDMVNEGNGGAGVHKGVGLEEFRGVMIRAGVFN